MAAKKGFHSLTEKAQARNISTVELVAEALRESDGSISGARNLLGVSATAINYWLPKLRITRHVSVEVEIIEAQT